MRKLGTTAMILLSALASARCGGDGGGTEASGASSSTTGTPSGAGGAGTSGSGTSSSGASSSGSGGATVGDDIPGGGTVLFQEPFDDDKFGGRGWYDGSSGSIDPAEHIPGSPSSYACVFATGATTCTAGKPARHKFTGSSSVYLSFYIKFSANWVGSGKPYHPHMFHFISDADTDYVGPAHTFLTTYTEVVAGDAFLALQDSKNVDLNCILKNDDSFVGCNGDFKTYPFTEARSACACNGLLGDLEGRDCFPNGNGTWYSSRSWRSKGAFVDTPGPNDKNAWHLVEAYFQMNTVQGGVGVPDGKIRWVQDKKTLISHDKILFRTGAHSMMLFNQFAMLPYIGDGSPVNQTFWVDDLTVATARP